MATVSACAALRGGGKAAAVKHFPKLPGKAGTRAGLMRDEAKYDTVGSPREFFVFLINICPVPITNFSIPLSIIRLSSLSLHYRARINPTALQHSAPRKMNRDGGPLAFPPPASRFSLIHLNLTMK